MISRNSHLARAAGIAIVASILAWAGQGGVRSNQLPNRPGDGGPADKAIINGPQSIAFDKAGNLYVYERNDEGPLDVIRRIDAATRIVTTLPVAGCDLANRERNPSCIGPITQLRAGGSGELLFSEFLRGRLRRLDLRIIALSIVAGNGGNESTGDGGPASQAGIKEPTCLAADNSRDMFVCDSASRIRRIDAETGIITTVAGNGTQGDAGDRGPATSAQVGPTSIAVATNGDIYFANRVSRGRGTIVPTSYRIRRIDTSSGIIETVAGSGAEVLDGSGFKGSGQPALATELYDPRALTLDGSRNLFFLNGGALTNGGSTVARVDLASGRLFAVAGNGRLGATGDGGPATRATFYGSDLAIDAAGNLFIADWLSNRIRRIDSKTGIISTFAGIGVRHKKRLGWQ